MDIDLLSDEWPQQQNLGSTEPLQPQYHQSTPSSSKTMQHDLEKLQEAHDKLMHQLEDKKSFACKLHEQLDKLVEENNDLKLQLEEKNKDLESVAKRLKEQDDLSNQIKEAEVKITKLKQLAAKYKKELAELREELDRKNSLGTQEVKDATKELQKEVDRVSSSYQQSIRNFQNLQGDFDKLQDEFDVLSGQKKRCEQDLNQSFQELNKLRVEVAEAKHENESLVKKIMSLEKEAEVQFNRRKDLEGKVIVLENELSEEKKKVQNNAGLERHLTDLRIQLNHKTNEVADLSEVADRFKDLEEECLRVKELLTDSEEQKLRLKNENEVFREENWNLSRKIESLNSSIESERLRVLEVLEENQALKSKEDKFKEANLRLQTDLETKVRNLRQQLLAAEESLSFKDKEFESYKKKVARVLFEKQHESEDVRELKGRIEEIESSRDDLLTENENQRKQLDSLLFEKKSGELKFASQVSALNETIDRLRSQGDSLEKECESSKSLCRDLQCQLVSQRSQYERQVEDLKNTSEEKHQSLFLENQSLLEKIKELESSLSSCTLTTETKTIKGKHEMPPTSAFYRSTDDVESLLSTSLTKKTSRSSSQSEEGSVGLNNDFSPSLIISRRQSLSRRSQHEVDVAKIKEEAETLRRIQVQLEDSEANNQLLTEQNQVLKEEVRKLERTISRMEVAQNMEYLKNLLIKYLSLPPASSEKQRLVPVLKTLLKLDGKEEKILVSNANDELPDTDPSPGQASSWSSLLWG